MSEEINTNFPALAGSEKALVSGDQENGLLNIIRSSRRLLVVVFMLVIFAAAARPIKDPDFYWHLKTGQYLLETRSIPSVDVFSYVKFGSEWVTHEWMSELFMYSIFKVFGYLGLIVVFAGIISATFNIA